MVQFCVPLWYDLVLLLLLHTVRMLSEGLHVLTSFLGKFKVATIAPNLTAVFRTLLSMPFILGISFSFFVAMLTMFFCLVGLNAHKNRLSVRLSDNCFQALSPCFSAQITFVPGPAADKHMYGPHTFLNSSDFRSHKSVSIHEKLASCNASNKSYMKLLGGLVDIMRRGMGVIWQSVFVWFTRCQWTCTQLLQS